MDLDGIQLDSAVHLKMFPGSENCQELSRVLRSSQSITSNYGKELVPFKCNCL